MLLVHSLDCSVNFFYQIFCHQGLITKKTGELLRWKDRFSSLSKWICIRRLPHATFMLPF
jgi:hypothetical protein